MLKELAKRLKEATTDLEKVSILNSHSVVTQFFKDHLQLEELCLSLEKQLIFKQLIVINQADRIFGRFKVVDEKDFFDLLDKLKQVDDFYREIGGLVGYQASVESLLKGNREGEEVVRFHPPTFIDIAKETKKVQKSIQWGLDSLFQMAEIYPLGGAADRLHLKDEKTGVELPAAKLSFAGITLLERLIRDLEAREYLYFQKYGTQLVTPIAMMTSHEKDNHEHIQRICEKNDYFGRPKDSIRLFAQPLVPTVDEKGNWCMRAPLKPLFKPGGHGAIWKLARDLKIFAWLKSLGRKKALIRQINNPIAGLDYGLLAFTGIGVRKQMVFGFASCPRLLKSAEGVNVLVEKEKGLYLTNIEYCDFSKFGIEDCPLKEKGGYSRFSSNTNILFADLEAVEKAVDTCPFPGLLVHLKKSSSFEGQVVARLESTMQNIADVFVESKGKKLKTKKTFVTYNLRHKTISTAKRAFIPNQIIRETPENCFYDLLQAHRELLMRCGFSLPSKRSLEQHLSKGPEFIFLYHPALGPLYSIIEKKIKVGSIKIGSEWIANLSDLHVRNLNLKGSLQILAHQPVGSYDNQNQIHFSSKIGSCILENVTIENEGIDWSCSQPFWKMDLKRQETVKIILKGKSKFIARNLCLQGSHTFVVEDGKLMKIL